MKTRHSGNSRGREDEVFKPAVVKEQYDGKAASRMIEKPILDCSSNVTNSSIASTYNSCCGPTTVTATGINSEQPSLSQPTPEPDQQREIPSVDEDQLNIGQIIGTGSFCTVSEIEKVKTRCLLVEPFSSSKPHEHEDENGRKCLSLRNQGIGSICFMETGIDEATPSVEKGLRYRQATKNDVGKSRHSKIVTNNCTQTVLKSQGIGSFLSQTDGEVVPSPRKSIIGPVRSLQKAYFVLDEDQSPSKHSS